MDNTSIQKDLFDITKRIKKLFVHHSQNHLNHSKYMVLRTIYDCCKNQEQNSDGIKISDLVTRLRVSKPAVSKIISSLEESGDIVRVIGKEDKRTAFLRLTESGEKKAEECIRHMDKMLLNIMQRMGEEDSIQLVRLLNKLYDILESEMNQLHEEESKERD